MTGLRFIKGQDLYGVGNSTITVPTALPTQTSSTSLLMNFTNAGIWDSTGRSTVRTVDSIAVSTVESKFGTGSIYVPGSGNGWAYTTISPDAVMVLPGDFTIEAWAYSTNIANLFRVFGIGDSALASGMSAIYFRNDGVYSYGNATQFISSGTTQSQDTWYHLALVRSGSTMTMYKDGVSVGTTTYSGTFSSYPYIASANNAGNIYAEGSGYIYDLRVTKGVARYTENFTPANYPFPVK
jgi:hypothetical protein